MKIHFDKYHGLGNDFVILSAGDLADDMNLDALARHWCDRHRGIGADGLLLHSPTDEAAGGRMVIYNADGSRPEMCGNGLRCVARWVFETGRVETRGFDILTDRGPLHCRVTPPDEHDDWLVETDLGAPEYNAPNIPMTSAAADTHIEVGPGFDLRGVSMGNPHAVIMVEDRDTRAYAKAWGEEISEHSLFPNRTNVEFVHQISDDYLDVTVYERGCGITEACGTGAAATVAALARDNDSWRNRPVDVELPGGILTVTATADTILLRGPAEKVFSGKIAVKPVR